MSCKIIGVLDNGSEGLTENTLHAIQSADLVIGATRTLALFSEPIAEAEQKDLTGHLTEVSNWVTTALESNKKVVVLATGDPLCHGIAGYLYKKLLSDQVEILPNISSVQLAFARIGVSWQDAKIISVHTKDAGEWQKGASTGHGLFVLFQALLNCNKLAILTGPENTPDRIARLLLLEQLADQFTITVAEDLLNPNEKVIQGESVESIAQQSFNGNDIVILQRKQAMTQPILFGLPDTVTFYNVNRKKDSSLSEKYALFPLRVCS